MGLTFAEKQWLHAALNLMGFASDFDGGVGVAEGEAEEVADDIAGGEEVDVVDVPDALAACQWAMSQTENAIYSLGWSAHGGGDLGRKAGMSEGMRE